MNRSQKIHCLLYILIAISALVCTSLQLKPYLTLGLIAGNVHFWQETMATAASRFMTIDVMFVFLVVWWWMMTEARRLKISNYGWYFPAAVLISFSATLPIFMLHREFARSRLGLTEAKSENLNFSGTISIGLLACGALGYSFYAWHFIR